MLPLGLANLAITSRYRTDFDRLFAGLILVTIPALIVYIAPQKHLVKGSTAGALKG
jgi:ABC-type glycerol-3-phosphate transport system permease component